MNIDLSSVHHVPGIAPKATDTKVNNIIPALMELRVQAWGVGGVQHGGTQ